MEKIFSLFTVIKNKDKYTREFQRIKNANTKYPILIAEVEDGGPIYIIDGLHRIAKSYYLLKRKTIRVQYVSQRDMNKAKL